MDPRAREARVDGQVLALTPREFGILSLLLRHRGRAFSRAEILERTAGSDTGTSDRSVEVMVFGLRRKLDAAGLPSPDRNPPRLRVHHPVKRPSSLAWRLTAPLALAVLLAMGAVALFMDHQVDSELDARFRDALLAQAKALTTVVEFEEGRLVTSSGGSQPSLMGGDAPISYELRCEGRAAMRSEPAPPAPPGWPGQATTTPRFDELDDAGGTQTVMFRFDAPYPAAPGERPRYHAQAPRTCWLLVSRPRHDMDQLLLTMDWILALGPVAASLAMLLAVPWLVRRGLVPLRTLAERMRGIGPQAPASRLPEAGIKELEPLVARFNEVLARMDEVLARERQFASGLAHETRTRLAELRSLVDVETRFPSERSAQEVMAEVGAIGAELEATVTALLELTRLEAGFEPARREAGGHGCMARPHACPAPGHHRTAQARTGHRRL